MKNITEIFLATDFEEHSKHAEKKAARLANKMNVPLSIIHVFKPDMITPGPYYSAQSKHEDWIKEIMAENRNRAKELLDNLFTQLEAKGQKYFLEGNPKEKIVEFIKSNDVHYLVVGTQKNKPAELSSVSHYILKQANCSVLLVP